MFALPEDDALRAEGAQRDGDVRQGSAEAVTSGRSFAEALLDPERAAPAGLKGPGAKKAVKRFAVYRNTVVVSLIDALAATFPAVQRIVGEEFFRAMARVHVLETPPVSPLIAEYGRDFPAFLERFEHVAAMPYLPDVARAERAWLDAYHAADAAPLDPAQLGAVPPERLGEVRFVPHPAARIVRSRYAVSTLTAANRSDAPVTGIDAGVPEDALIVRPALEVSMLALPPGGAAFLCALMDGATLGEAAALAAEEVPDFDLASNIGAMLEVGVHAALTLDDEQAPRDPATDAPERTLP